MTLAWTLWRQTLIAAEAISEAGWILGNGSSGSYTREMVLVPQKVSDN